MKKSLAERIKKQEEEFENRKKDNDKIVFDKEISLDSDKIVESIKTKEEADAWVSTLCKQFQNNPDYNCTPDLCENCMLKDFDNIMKFVNELDEEAAAKNKELDKLREENG